MIVHNLLPNLLGFLEKYSSLPTKKQFTEDFLDAQMPLLHPMLDDFSLRFDGGMYDVLTSLDWTVYRNETLTLDPIREESRLKQYIKSVEALLGKPLAGESVLFGGFTMMDGYARFEKGSHRVFLGVDESHNRGKYLDVLISHELAHVARESIPDVWTGYGLNPEMTHDEFVDYCPTLEHLMNEGFSCVVSELLNPDEEKWAYTYQDADSLKAIMDHSCGMDQFVHSEISKELRLREKHHRKNNPTKSPGNGFGNGSMTSDHESETAKPYRAGGAYRRLYDVTQYKPEVPRFAHYVWAWAWVKQLLQEIGQGDPRKLVGQSSDSLYHHALGFSLEKHRHFAYT